MSSVLYRTHFFAQKYAPQKPMAFAVQAGLFCFFEELNEKIDFVICFAFLIHSSHHKPLQPMGNDLQE